MTVIVETGRGVDGANSYVTASDVISYLAERGMTISEEDANLESQIVTAFDYINGCEDKLTGYRTNSLQVTAYPRANLWINDYTYLDANTIPKIVKDLQTELVKDIRNGINIYNRPFHLPLKSATAEASVDFAVKNVHPQISETQAVALLRQLTTSYKSGIKSIPVISRG